MRNLNPVWMNSGQVIQGFDWNTNLYDYWNFDTIEYYENFDSGYKFKGINDTLRQLFPYIDEITMQSFQDNNSINSVKSFKYNISDLGGSKNIFLSGDGNKSSSSASFWIYFPTVTTSDYFFSFFSSDINGYIDNDDRIVIDDGNSTYTFNTPIIQNSWNHFVRNGLDIYLNGILQSNLINIYEFSPTFNSVWFSTSQTIHVNLDELVIWNNRILTQNEVSQLYNNGNGLFYT